MVVQKFGGTSVADPDAIRRLIEIVRAARARDGRGPVVVVSAMSGVTDALLGIASAAGAGNGVDGRARQDRTAARASSGRGARPGRAGATQAALATDIDATVRSAAPPSCRRSRVLREVSPRTLDVIAAMGELLSSRIVAAALTAAGVDGRMGGCAPRHRHQRRSHAGDAADCARPTRALRATVVPLLDAGRVPVLGGFVGATRRRAHDDARARRLGLLRRARRRRHRRARDSDLDRRGRHADRRSARHRGAAPRAAAVVRRGRGARLFRREGAASEHDPAGRRAQHSRAHPQLAASRRATAR